MNTGDLSKLLAEETDRWFGITGAAWRWQLTGSKFATDSGAEASLFKHLAKAVHAAGLIPEPSAHAQTCPHGYENADFCADCTAAREARM